MEKIFNMTNIPKDVTQGVPLISIIGNEELFVENFRGILEYTCELIRIQTKIGRILIKGKGLSIESYSHDDMKIRGHIYVVEYQVGGT